MTLPYTIVYAYTLNKHAPYKTITRKESKSKLKPWLSQGIIKSIQIKNTLYKKFIRSKDLFLYSRYKLYRDKLNKLIRPGAYLGFYS